MRGSPEARCANPLYSCGSGEPYRSKQCGLEAGKVKAKRLISTGFRVFLRENSRNCRFLPVFLGIQRPGSLTIRQYSKNHIKGEGVDIFLFSPAKLESPRFSPRAKLQ